MDQKLRRVHPPAFKARVAVEALLSFPFLTD
jgi:hypothetical protein